MSTLIVPMVQIKSVEKHPNADTLTIVKFEGFGWQSIAKIGQYEAGDWVIFVPPDAIIPEWIIKDQEINYLKGKNSRVGATRLRGQLSEGVILPLDILHKNPFEAMGDASVMIGDNVASRLGINKYEPETPDYAKQPKKRRQRKYNDGTFPTYTDIQHLKNFPDVFTLGRKVVITEKIHGTNFRAGWAMKQNITLKDRIAKIFGRYDPFYFTCGSRTVEMGLDKPKDSWYDHSVTKRKKFEYNLYQKWASRLKSLIPYGYIFFGEIYGDGVQDLTYGLGKGDTKIVIFDIMYGGKYLNYLDAINIMSGKLDYVPVLYVGEYSPEVVQELTDGISALGVANGVRQIREGVVVKPFDEEIDPVAGRLIFKSVSVDYLNRKGGTEFK